jgi:hypothetical protein
MKNIFVLPTDKPSTPSRLFYKDQELVFSKKYSVFNGVNIYITSTEPIKEGDWYYDCGDVNFICKAFKHTTQQYQRVKIILTTDQDLIADGVQSIDDEFLEWFIKNPSCEFVEVEPSEFLADKVIYEIIIPQEETKQETLEEVIKPIGDFIIENATALKGQDGAYYHYAEVCKLLKLQSKRMYSEEEVLNIIADCDGSVAQAKKWFEQFKKK